MSIVCQEHLTNRASCEARRTPGAGRAPNGERPGLRYAPATGTENHLTWILPVLRTILTCKCAGLTVRRMRAATRLHRRFLVRSGRDHTPGLRWLVLHTATQKGDLE